jgi:lysozyme family protein
MDKEFLEFMPFVFRWEGETYENSSSDPGGETKFGIDKRSHPEIDIAALTKEKALEIYWQEFQTIPSALVHPVKWVFFDTQINCGKTQAIKLLQRALFVRPDGDIGEKTAEALSSEDKNTIAFNMIDQREAFYKRLAYIKPDLEVYLQGWLNRCADLRVEIRNIIDTFPMMG